MAVNIDKTHEQLDMQDFGKPTDDSHLVTTVHQLRKKKIKNFSVEDLRIIIGQNFNLDILIPLAIARLKENILAEGDFYPGDLLKNVLDSDSDYWTKHREQWVTVKSLYADNGPIFEVDKIYRQIRKSFEYFEKI